MNAKGLEIVQIKSIGYIFYLKAEVDFVKVGIMSLANRRKMLRTVSASGIVLIRWGYQYKIRLSKQSCRWRYLLW